MKINWTEHFVNVVNWRK